MKPGHENCPRDTTVLSKLSGETWAEAECLHRHTDPVQRGDTGEIIGYYCNCCGRRRTTR